ncbi:MAG: hypothetical protein HKO59_07235 [Phycisphaerales bacterium]|nr:hypothetical protein [Phycisphaerales bacterium]NNM25768.1 hypothetical protein [Phycisphaerales bacterium]
MTGSSIGDTTGVRRAGGIGIIVTAFASGALGWLILALLGNIAREQEIVLPGVVLLFVQRPWLAALLALPALTLGLALFRTRRRGWMLAALGTALTLTPVAVVLYSFVRVLAPLYGVE